MMKWSSASLLVMLYVMVGCSGGEVESSTEGIETEQATAATAVDTSKGKIQKEETDSTLQVVEEVTLKAIGEKKEEMRFDQDTLEVKAGSLVKLKLVNEGTEQSMIYNVVFTQPGKSIATALAGEKIGASGNYVPRSDQILAASPLALPGQTVEMEFIAPKEPGAYDFVCTYPGFYQVMNGKLIVRM